MEPIPLHKNAPISLILACDGLFSTQNLENDHVWEIQLATNNQFPILLQTTYGLRAISMRLFPEINLNNQSLFKFKGINKNLAITSYSPALIQLSMDLEQKFPIQLTFFIVESHVVAGKVQIINKSESMATMDFVMAAVLIPIDPGFPTQAIKSGIHHIVVGQSNNLFPVLFMSGGPVGLNNPYPALSSTLTIPPGQSTELAWVLATEHDQASSLKKAQSVLASNWQENALEQRMHYEQNSFKIRTGEPSWDTAFMLTQTTAMTHVVNGSSSTSEPSFVRSRLPDQTHAHNELNNLTTLDLQHLAKVLPPPYATLVTSQIERCLNYVSEDGHLMSQLIASPLSISYQDPPLLGHLCLQLYEINQNTDFLKHIFPTLCKITETWLKQPRKSQELSCFSWQNPDQLQMDTGLFTFDIWNETGKGLNITKVESPALIAMLLMEVTALNKMAEILGENAAKTNFTELIAQLKHRLENAWVESRQSFSYRDCDSLESPAREFYYPSDAKKEFKFQKTFYKPQRLQVHIYSSTEHTKNIRVEISGKDLEGLPIIESFKNKNIQWVLGRVHLTTNHIFSKIETILIEGLDEKDKVLIETVDLSQCDISCLLPIWTGAIKKNQEKAIINTILTTQNKNHGIPETWKVGGKLPQGLPIRINILWNTLIIEGMVHQGYIDEAKDLFTNLMNTILRDLKGFDGFFPFYDWENQQPVGQRNAISGLPPIMLFLQIAGIKLINPNRIATWGVNPFPWPIQIHWQGTSIIKENSFTKIVFSNGACHQHETEEPVLVTPKQAI